LPGLIEKLPMQIEFSDRLLGLLPKKGVRLLSLGAASQLILPYDPRRAIR
jgi:hypothetical protein